MPDIYAYTLAQVRAFLRAIDRRRRTDLKDLASAVRAAGAEQRGFKAYVRELDGQ